jgi:hypothetical protein
MMTSNFNCRSQGRHIPFSNNSDASPPLSPPSPLPLLLLLLPYSAKGKWELAVEEGVKCYKGFEDNYLAVRVPFRKNGGGMHLNQYTISMYVKFRKVEGFDRVRYLPQRFSTTVFKLIPRADL